MLIQRARRRRICTIGARSRVPYQTSTYIDDPANNLFTLAYANGDSTVYTTDQMNRVTSVTDKKGSAVLFSQSYSLDYEGKRTAVAESHCTNNGLTLIWSSTESLVYDNLDRLEDEDGAQIPIGEQQ